MIDIQTITPEHTSQSRVTVSEYPLHRYAQRGEPILDLRSSNQTLHHAAHYPVFSHAYTDIPSISLYQKQHG